MRRGTYSIVARDPVTGELGVAVQSHWFSVGSVVAWARPGVGAVATQSVAEVAHGPNALDRLQHGLDPRADLGCIGHGVIRLDPEERNALFPHVLHHLVGLHVVAMTSMKDDIDDHVRGTR